MLTLHQRDEKRARQKNSVDAAFLDRKQPKSQSTAKMIEDTYFSCKK